VCATLMCLRLDWQLHHCRSDAE